ncbi:MAG: Cthe_2314 family HEPN domain-containing protein [Longimicrobiaceae bacterium]
MTLDELHEHKLLTASLENVKPLLSLAEDRTRRAFTKGKFRSDEEATLSPEESYHLQVFNYSTTLLSTIDKAGTCQLLLRRFPEGYYDRASGITPFTWMSYHYGYYIVILNSIVDIALVLTNVALTLGFEEKKCKWHTIVKDSRVRRLKLNDVLEKLDKVITVRRELRNVHVHRGEDINLAKVLDDDLVNAYHLIDFTTRISQKANNGTDTLDPEKQALLEYGHRTTSSDLNVSIQTELDSIINVTGELFNSLYRYYNAATKIFAAAKLAERFQQSDQDK